LLRFIVTALCAAPLLSLAACGGEGLHGDARAAADTIHRYQHHLIRGEAREACALLTPRGRRELGGVFSSCEERAREIGFLVSPEQKAAIGKFLIRHVSVKGTRAVITANDVELPAHADGVYIDHNGPPTVLRRVHGSWLIDQIG
jgi:hypothetical protein